MFRSESDYQFLRRAYTGGPEFLRDVLERLSDDESATDYNRRLRTSPTPVAARSIVGKVLTAFANRMRYCVRYGKLLDTVNAGRGIDNHGATVDQYMTALAEHLAIDGRVGVFVDSPRGIDSLEVRRAHPYCHTIRACNLRKVEIAPSNSPSVYSLVEWQSADATKVYRVWLDGDKVMGRVEEKDKPSEPVEFVGQTRIPFVLIEADSMMAKLAHHEVSLTNLMSVLSTNSPDLVQAFLTRQNSGLPFDDSFGKTPTQLGREKGLKYGPKENAPSFVAPPAAPFTEARMLVGAVVDRMYDLAGVSGETEAERDESVSGVVAHYGDNLQAAEREIWRLVAGFMREVGGENLATVPVVKYPTWHAQTEANRLSDVTALYANAQRASGRSGMQAATILAVEQHFAGQQSSDIQKAVDAVQAAPCLLNDAASVIRAFEAGAIDGGTAADSLGCIPGVAAKASAEKLQKARQLAAAAAFAAQAKQTDRFGGIGSDRDGELADKALSQSNGEVRGENR